MTYLSTNPPTDLPKQIDAAAVVGPWTRSPSVVDRSSRIPGSGDWKGTPMAQLLPVELNALGHVKTPVEMYPTESGKMHYLLQIALLEPVAGPARGAGRTGPRWGLRQQLLTLGTLMILGGAVMAGLVASYFFLFVPKRIPVETLPPLSALVLWDSLQLGISGDPADTTAQLLLMIDRHYKRSMVIAAAVGAVGALVFVVGLMVPRQSAAEPFSPESGAT